MSARIETRGRRRVVLKPLDDDCLLDGEVHPSIAARLMRVRELPMTSVANLRGAERIDSRAYLVWDYVEGRTLEEALVVMSREQIAKTAAELRLVVEAMHSHGIVHGAIHARNVIIDDRAVLHLTHVSPLLHNDSGKDLAAMDEMFRSATAARPHAEPSTSRFAGTQEGEGINSEVGEDDVRGPAILRAAVMAALGVLIVAFFVYFASLHS